MIRDVLLKNALAVLIDKFGLKSINDKIAELMYEKAHRELNMLWDDLSDAYDKINKDFFIFKQYQNKK